MNAPLFDAQAFDSRIEAACRAKLGCEVTIKEWRKLKSGAEVPVIIVPSTHRQAAIDYGLTVAQ